MYVYERFTFLCVKFIFIQLKYYIFYCRNEMKSITIKLKHRNLFYIIILCFISFLTRFSRIPHPQAPNQNELFELYSSLNFSRSNLTESSNSYVGLLLRREYLKVSFVNLTMYLENTTKVYQYRITTLRQYSAFFSIFIPVLTYILLLYYRVNDYILSLIHI